MLVTFNTSNSSSKNTTGQVKNFQRVSTSTNFYTLSKRRSRNGCVTCKIRKKKCDEAKPSCGDCERLGRECVWQDPDMSENEVKDLKNKVENYETSHKIRKRKPKSVGSLGHYGQYSPRNSGHMSNQVDVLPINDLDPKLYSIFKVGRVQQCDSNQRSTTQRKNSASTTEKAVRPQEVRSRSPIYDLLDPEPPSMDQSNDIRVHYTPHSVIKSSFNNTDLSPSPKSWSVDFPSPTPSFLSLLKDLNQFDPEKIKLLDDENDVATAQDTSNSDDGLDPFSPLSVSCILNAEFPSPSVGLSDLPVQLDDVGLQLYTYYHDKLAKMICIAPQDENLYVKVFLPMAHRDSGVLYSIIAWAGFHLGGEWETIGLKYTDMALTHLNKQTNSNKRNGALITGHSVEHENLLLRLANLLILCGAEICRGDVKNWSFYLSWGSKLINSYGGILNFTGNKDQQWLVSNFAYHDILASSTSERGTYFPIRDYEKVFQENLGSDTLLGVSKTLYNLIGEVSTLALESKRLLQLELLEDGEDDDNADSAINAYKLFSRIVTKAKYLEEKIDNAKPDPEDLMDLNPQDLEWQLTLFETFQLTAKLHLRQSILKINPSSLETQLLLHDLIRCLDIILKTPVEGGLCFPIFIAGITCITYQDRCMMRDRYDDFINRYGCRNVDKAKFIMEEVWKLNDSGDKIIDWYGVVKGLDWDLSFA